jgi:hypothetical protein
LQKFRAIGKRNGVSLLYKMMPFALRYDVAISQLVDGRGNAA